MNTIIINGSIRSGTTWILEVISKSKLYFPIFEPDNHYADAIKYKLRYKFLDPANNNPPIDTFFHLLLSGELNKLKVDSPYSNNLLKKYYYLRRDIRYFIKNRNKAPIIKFTRAHLFLNYLFKLYNTRNIVVFRHPCAVTWSAYTKNYLVSDYEELLDDRQIELFDKYPGFFDKVDRSLCLLDYKKLWNKNVSQFERKSMIYIINWAFVNSFLINDVISNGLKVLPVYYEELFQNPSKGFKIIADYLGIDLDDRMTNQIFQKSSSSSDSSFSDLSH